MVYGGNGSETSWNVYDQNSNVVLNGSGYASSTAYGGEECINAGCYTFIMSDTYGDGMVYGGTYSVAVNGVNVIQSGGNFGYSESTEFCATLSPPACNDNSFVFQLLTDSYGSETSWTLSTENDGIAASGSGYASNTAYDLDACINDGCYTFLMEDSYGDGICCSYGDGYYSVAVNGANVIQSGGDFGSSESTDFCTSSTLAPTSAPSSLAPTACDGSTFTWQLLTDNYGSETRWTLFNDNTGILVLSGDDYFSYTAYGGEECIENACYTFIMSETYGDGMCCQYGEGNYSFAVNGVNEIESGGDFGSSETTEFCCLTETPTTLPPLTPQPTATPTTEPPTTPQPTATPTACDGNAFTWQLLTDNYGSETSWTLSTTNTDNLVLSGDGYASSTEYGGEECINNGCYTFIMSDTYG